MKIVSKMFQSVASFVTIVLASVTFAFAQVNPDPRGLVNDPGGNDLENWIVTLLQFLIGFAGIIAVAILIFNGIMYMTASGDENKIAKATKGITYAIVGLVIAAISFLLVTFIIQRVIFQNN
jgi:type IV secretory pathway VirB2 component (pilin)